MLQHFVTKYRKNIKLVNAVWSLEFLNTLHFSILTNHNGSHKQYYAKALNRFVRDQTKRQNIAKRKQKLYEIYMKFIVQKIKMYNSAKTCALFCLSIKFCLAYKIAQIYSKVFHFFSGPSKDSS